MMKLCRVVALACALAACLSVPTTSIDSSSSRKSESGRGKSLLRSGASAQAQATTLSKALPPQTASSVATCPPEDVAELSENEFEQVFKTGLLKDTIVYFYNDNLAACAAFDPKYDCVGKEYKPAAADVLISKFPAADHPYVKDSYDIKVYPSVRFFPKGFKFSPTSQGVDYTGPLERDNIVAWVRTMRGKTLANVADHIPAKINIQVGTKPDFADVIEDGEHKIGSPLTLTTEPENMLYVQVEDATIDRAQLCEKHGLGTGRCLKAVSMSDTVCKVAVARPTDNADREKGGHRVWYQCLSAGECKVAAEVVAAPSPVIFHWSHQCGSASRAGFKVGTFAGTGDVVNNGEVDQDWRMVGAEPKAEVDAAESKTLFSMVDTLATTGFDVRPMTVTVSDPKILTTKVTGDVLTDIQAAAKDIYMTHPGVVNAALKKPATMSSVWNKHFPHRAVDGNHGTEADSHTACAISGNHGQDAEPYLDIDLGEPTMQGSIVKRVRVWNTPSLDTQYRLVPMTVMVSAVPFPRTLAAAKKVAMYTKSFTDIHRFYDFDIVGDDAFVRYVRVQLVNRDFLQIAEVEVFAIPESIRCDEEQGKSISDHGIAICAKGGLNKPVSSTLHYKCKKPGTVNVGVTVPLFPEYHPNPPLNFFFKKSCKSDDAVDFIIGKGPHESQIVDSGVVDPGFAYVDTVKAALATKGRKLISGSERVLVNYMQMSKSGMSQSIKWPNMTVVYADNRKVMKPQLLPWHLTQKNLTVMDQPTGVNMSFSCTEKGVAMVNVKLAYTPIYQPYAPIQYSILKECGGRPVGLNVFMAGEGKDMKTGKIVPTFSDDPTLVAVKDGTARPAFADTDPDKGAGIISRESTSTVFYLDVPPTEVEHTEGHRVAPPTPCRNTLFSGSCRQLQKSHTHGAPIRASCSPNVCSGDVFGFTPGPVISGEAFGSGPSTPAELAAANGKVPVSVTYHCSRRTRTTVSLTFQNEFYDPVTVSYEKECFPWSHTTVGMIVWWTSLVLCSVGVVAAILFIGGEKSLYHRMTYGPSLDYVEME